jgi:tripartite-type tricarboxylate transporter receptor subunit TctC
VQHSKALFDAMPVRRFNCSSNFSETSMKTIIKLRILMQVGVCALALSTTGAFAQATDWPTKPVTLVVPFPAGGGTDAFARPMAAVLSKSLGKQIVIDNRGGAGPALQGLMAGDVDMMFDGLGSSAAHIKSGRIKPLMVAGAQRNPAIPNVPSAAELGFPDYTVSTWYAIWAPKGTPPAVQAKLIAEIKKLPKDDTIVKVWANNGAQFPDVTGAQFGTFVDSEIKRWADVVKASGAKLD